MNVASIDIGSNTVLLLIAEINLERRTFRSLHNEYRVPRISKGLQSDNRISREKISELLEVLKEYKNIANSYRCQKIFVVGTNALRIASNSLEIKELIFDKLNLDIKIVSGADEAELSYSGVKSSFTELDKINVLDIGGGSTEIINGTANLINFRKSFPFASVNLTEELVTSYPISNKEIDPLDRKLDHIFNDSALFPFKGIPLVAVAGTPTSLTCIIQNIKTYDEEIVEKSVLTYEQLIRLSKEFEKSTPPDILKKYGAVVKGREDVIYMGTRILIKFMEILENENVLVSGRGLRFGIVADYIKGL